MNRFILIFSILFLYNNLFSQINYYVGYDLLSTNSKIVENNEVINQQNYNYSIYIGNEININKKVSIFIDIGYQNNKSVLKELEDYDTRFELHQTISMLLKPSVRYINSSFAPIIGVSGVYVFDKKEYTGEQIDRFDEGYLLGINFNQNLTQKISINFSMIYNMFNSVSHYTNTELKNYTTTSIGIQYNLYGSNYDL